MIGLVVLTVRAFAPKIVSLYLFIYLSFIIVICRLQLSFCLLISSFSLKRASQ